MKRASWLLGCCLALGCSAGSGDPAGSGGTANTSAGTAGTTSGGSTASAGTGGAGGTVAAGGGGAGGSVAGGSGGATPGGAGAGGTSGASGGSAGTTAGGGSGGGAGASGCVPDPNGALSVNAAGDTVHDPKTCLDWMKKTQSGVNYAAAEMFCGDATIGGFDDWRIPDASEFASIVTLCGKYAPDGPVDTKIFELAGDGYWTTTPAGEPNKVCAVGMLNAGGYYHYGTAGPQVVRCVRGSGTVKMVKDCTMAMGCSNW
jgi:hypothetical protein